VFIFVRRATPVAQERAPTGSIREPPGCIAQLAASGNSTASKSVVIENGGVVNSALQSGASTGWPLASASLGASVRRYVVPGMTSWTVKTHSVGLSKGIRLRAEDYSQTEAADRLGRCDRLQP
jgi:hypothetical protein